jgi:putative drug exporter of the RND superfamily
VQRQINRFLPKGVTDEQQIYVSSSRPLTAEKLQPLRERLARVPNVGQVSQPRFADANRAAEIDVALTIDAATSKALDLAGKDGPLRAAAQAGAPARATALVAGNASIFADVSDSVGKDLRLIFPVASLLVLLILFAMLHSLVAPLYLLLAVGLEFAATGRWNRPIRVRGADLVSRAPTSVLDLCASRQPGVREPEVVRL